MNENPFWIVVSESRGTVTWPYRHITQQGAIAEAVRLCREHGGKFYVFEAQHSISKQDVVVRVLSTGDDIPF